MPQYENNALLQCWDFFNMRYQTISEHPASEESALNDLISALDPKLRPFYQVAVVDGSIKRYRQLKQEYLQHIRPLFHAMHFNREPRNLSTESAFSALVQPLLDEMCEIRGVPRILFANIVGTFYDSNTMIPDILK